MKSAIATIAALTFASSVEARPSYNSRGPNVRCRMTGQGADSTFRGALLFKTKTNLQNPEDTLGMTSGIWGLTYDDSSDTANEYYVEVYP